ncbi:hypothetical protein GLE_4784 [Lysobacter enzymogenes]|uniref:Uncharacterized protein n=1 Tax=Lysobacter enzymogenes TaxID=69 RepID=A0A0S2DP09_LYSEN|nr:hypothetical protein GLE_4784 [Lysobacter enzymogenes]
MRSEQQLQADCACRFRSLLTPPRSLLCFQLICKPPLTA